jgi:hypothetical protein
MEHFVQRTSPLGIDTRDGAKSDAKKERATKTTRRQEGTNPPSLGGQAIVSMRQTTTIHERSHRLHRHHRHRLVHHHLDVSVPAVVQGIDRPSSSLKVSK